MKRPVALFLFALFSAAALVPAAADPVQFKLLPNYSRATFKTDAPLETIVGNSVAGGLSGTLTVDPAKPQSAVGSIRVDMSTVKTGIDKRDADMLDPRFLDVAASEANKFVTFEVKSVEIAGALEPDKAMPARVSGILTIKQKPVSVVAQALVTWVKLGAEHAEAQKRFGFTPDNIKVRAKLATTFTDHGMQVPQLLFLKVSNEIQLETDLTFVRQ
ncbi:MAG: YceI family protein [Candidatus Rokubacteria bacterium]|nr:YceI family protein [Candidatus Rokubacteria bacterium]